MNIKWAEFESKMVNYTYKGFTVSYQIKTLPQKNLFQAIGSAKSDSQSDAQNFQTEAITRKDAEKELKKLIEDYIDFEVKQFIETQGEY